MAYRRLTRRPTAINYLLFFLFGAGGLKGCSINHVMCLGSGMAIWRQEAACGVLLWVNSFGGAVACAPAKIRVVEFTREKVFLFFCCYDYI